MIKGEFLLCSYSVVIGFTDYEVSMRIVISIHTFKRIDLGREVSLMNILLWLILGALSGWIASMIMGTNNQQGLFTDIILGVVGAMVGGFSMGFFGAQGVTGFNLYSILVSVLGAVILIAIGRALSPQIA